MRAANPAFDPPNSSPSLLFHLRSRHPRFQFMLFVSLLVVTVTILTSSHVYKIYSSSSSSSSPSFVRTRLRVFSPDDHSGVGEVNQVVPPLRTKATASLSSPPSNKCAPGSTQLQNETQYDLPALLNLAAYNLTPQYTIELYDNATKHRVVANFNASTTDPSVHDALRRDVMCTWPDSLYALYHQELSSHSTESPSSVSCPRAQNVLHRPDLSLFQRILRSLVYATTTSAPLNTTTASDPVEEARALLVNAMLAQRRQTADTTQSATESESLPLVIQVDPTVTGARSHRLLLHAVRDLAKSASAVIVVPFGQAPAVTANPSAGGSLLEASISSSLSARNPAGVVLPSSYLLNAADLNDAVTLTARVADALVRLGTRSILLPAPLSQKDYDARMLLFASAPVLLVSGGHGATLAAIAASSLASSVPFASASPTPRNRIYHTPDALRNVIDDHELHWQVLRNTRDVSHEPYGPHRKMYYGQWYALGEPLRVEDTCCDVEKFGEGDGEKFLCSNALSRTIAARRTAEQAASGGGEGDEGRGQDDECWILSIGCGGLFDFERLIHSKFPHCKIQLFDCTGSWTVPADIAHAVTLHKLCVGDAPANMATIKPFFRSLAELIRVGSGNATGRTDTDLAKRPALFKFDAEGAEFAVLDKMLDDTPPHLLPKQMVIEFHLRLWAAIPRFTRRRGTYEYYVPRNTSEHLFRKLHQYGYRTVYRADNPGDEACTELTLVLDHELPVRQHQQRLR